MSGGIRVTGNLDSGLVILKVQRDNEYDLMQIAERFVVPYGDVARMKPQEKLLYVAMIDQRAREAAKLAVEKYERLRHWRFKSDMPVEVDESDAQFDLEHFRSSFRKDFAAVDQGSIIQELGLIAYVVKLWFIVPKITVEVIEDEPDDPDTIDGFVNSHKMEEYVKLGDD